MSYTPRHAKPSATKRRTLGLSAGLATAAATLASPAIASAQQDPFAATSSNIREDAWDTRNHLHDQAGALGPNADAARSAVDGAVDGIFPGLIEEKRAEEAAREEAARQEAANAEAARAEAARREAASNFDFGSCPAEARACIDLSGNRSWLQRNGEVTYGAVPMSAGAPGWDTPKGTHYVNRKVKDEVSYEFDLAPMPYSVYFTNNGIAFHEGDVNLLSHGCIHLNHNDAVHYFNDLQIGDMVYVY